MATMTYSTLTQDIKDWMENDGTEFSNETDNFISLAEQRISRDIEPYAFHESATSSFNSGDRFVSKPTDAKVIFHFIWLNSDSKRIFLEQRTDEFIYDYWPTSSTTGSPKYWANYSDTALLVAPTPNSSYVTELHYYYRPSSLTVGGDSGTTWLSTNAPNTLLYGCLFEAYVFMKGEQDVLAMYDKRFTESLSRLKDYGEARENTDAYRRGLPLRQRT